MWFFHCDLNCRVPIEQNTRVVQLQQTLARALAIASFNIIKRARALPGLFTIIIIKASCACGECEAGCHHRSMVPLTPDRPSSSNL